VYTTSYSGANGLGVSEQQVSGGDEVMWLVGSGSVHCYGQIVATFTWVPDVAEEPPTVAIVEEQGAASWTGTSGSCADGLGDTATAITNGQTSTGIYYWVKENPGNSFTITCSPEAQASKSSSGGPGSPPNAAAGVWYKALAMPLRLSLYGTTPGVDEEEITQIDYAEIGQQISAAPTVDGGASGITFQHYNWTIDGDKFKNYVVGSGPPENDPNAPAVVNYLTATDLTSSQPTWAWQTSNKAPEEVLCHLEILVGGVSIGYGDISRYATVLEPTSEMPRDVGPITYTYNGIQAGDPLNEEVPAPGVNFRATVTTNSIISDNLGPGKWMYVQLAKINADTTLFYTDVFGHWHIRYHSDVFELDNQWGYEPGDPANAWTADTQMHPAGDSPSWSLAGGMSFDIADLFTMYLMYRPPGTYSQWVTLKKIDWSWTTSGSRESSLDSWPEPPPGVITVSEAVECRTHPTWTTVMSNTVELPAPPLAQILHNKGQDKGPKDYNKIKWDLGK